MLETLGSKIISGIVSLSLFLFSSYTGNDAAMRPLQVVIGRSYVQIKTGLSGAFDNDFADVFRSGTTIPVEFGVVISSGRTTLISYRYSNTVVFDPINNIFIIEHNATGQRHQTSSYEDMIASISQFECSVPYQSAWKRVNIRVEASLPTVHFSQINRRVDLMVLWKFRKPSATISVDLNRPS